MSVAKKAVDSTLRKLLVYTAEIIMSLILLVVICIPLAFGIPIWFQTVVLGAAKNDLVINPIAWFGGDGAFWVTLLLSLVGFFLSYLYVYRLLPTAETEEEEEEEDEEEDLESEDLEEDVAIDEEDVEEVVLEATDEDNEVTETVVD